MIGVARQFMLLAVVFLLTAILLGLHMAMSNDHLLMPVHAHVMLAGWVSSAIFGFFYHLHPQVGASVWARVHFWLGAISVVIMTTALAVLLLGNPAGGLGAAIGSMGFGLSALIFGRNVLLGRS